MSKILLFQLNGTAGKSKNFTSKGKNKGGKHSKNDDDESIASSDEEFAEQKRR